MDAVENASLQISHSTSSHNDLYALELRKKKNKRKKEMWRKRENQCYFLLYTRTYSKLKASASPLIIRLLPLFADRRSGK